MSSNFVSVTGGLDGALVGGRFVLVGGSVAHFNDIGPSIRTVSWRVLFTHEFTKRIRVSNQVGALSCITVLIKLLVATKGPDRSG